MQIHKQGSIQMLLRVASGSMKTCYKRIGIDGKDNEPLRCIEVTPELYNKGVSCIADERSIVDKDGKVEATLLNVGDFVLVKSDGVYRMTRTEMRDGYVF